MRWGFAVTVDRVGKHQLISGIKKLEENLARHSALFASTVGRWMSQLSPSGGAEQYLSDFWMFPMIQLPLWMASSFSSRLDYTFHSRLTYSTINGYLFIRLVDNIMDKHHEEDSRLLPAIAFFQTEFQSAYGSYFKAIHPFWRRYRSLWFRSNEAAIREKDLASLDLAQFREVSASKLSAVQIPLVATAYHYHKLKKLDQWLRFSEDIARCWQFADDLFDWYSDSSAGRVTYFVSEGIKRKRVDETLGGWVAREGFEWGIQTLQEWGSQARNAARSFGNSELNRYLKHRLLALTVSARNISAGLNSIIGLDAVLSSRSHSIHQVLSAS